MRSDNGFRFCSVLLLLAAVCFVGVFIFWSIQNKKYKAKFFWRITFWLWIIRRWRGLALSQFKHLRSDVGFYEHSCHCLILFGDGFVLRDCGSVVQIFHEKLAKFFSFHVDFRYRWLFEKYSFYGISVFDAWLYAKFSEPVKCFCTVNRRFWFIANGFVA